MIILIVVNWLKVIYEIGHQKIIVLLVYIEFGGPLNSGNAKKERVFSSGIPSLTYTNIPKMLTSDSDDDDVLYVREGVPEENTLSFLALPELRGTPLSKSILGTYLPQNQCLLT